jgi:hypothetical protein
MKTILRILERAGGYRPTLYLKIDNPRRRFDEHSLNELAESFKTQDFYSPCLSAPSIQSA